MISYEQHTLGNGLRVVVHRPEGGEMAAVNMLYCVGARNENPERTGFAHLFEHLMFRGTRAVPDFDTPLHKACAENNAFTNNDYTESRAPSWRPKNGSWSRSSTSVTSINPTATCGCCCVGWPTRFTPIAGRR